MLQAQARLYELAKLGYYGWGSDDPDFGDNLGQLLGDMRRWSRHLTMRDVCLKQSDDESAIVGVYLRDMAREESTGDWFLVLWNEVPSHDGDVLAVGSADPVGSDTYTTSSLPQGSIPGFPTYFWFADNGRVVHLRTGPSTRGGRKQAEAALQGFMETYWPRHVKSTTGSDGIEVDGYRASHSDDPAHFYPKCVLDLKRVPDQVELIRECRGSIRKLVCKRVITPGGRADTTFLGRLLKIAGFDGNPTYSGEVRLKFEVSYEPTETELDSIIDDFVEGDDFDSYENVGVVLKGEQKTLWLSNARAAATFTLRLLQKPVHSSLEIRDAIRPRREEFMNMLESGG